MTTPCSVIHDTFTIERCYLATPQRVFAAFSSLAEKNKWGALEDAKRVEGGAGPEEFDFRVGGREFFTFRHRGAVYRYDARYYDIVPDHRIVYSYEMYSDDVRISVSLATIAFAKSGDGTALSWTEQGAYLDDFEGPAAPMERRKGTAYILDSLPGYLESQTPR